MVQAAVRQSWIATGVSIVAALAITVWLTQSIVPALREVVTVAQAIADGRLDNAIQVGGRDETGQMLGALAVMQSSIAAALARIRALMDEQASSHAGQTAAQHARFDAALSNMGQGLCLFGPDGRLQVANRRFADMFGACEPGATPAEALAGDGLADLLGVEAGTEASFSCDLPDGRTIAVTHRRVAGGHCIGRRGRMGRSASSTTAPTRSAARCWSASPCPRPSRHSARLLW